MAYLSTTEQLLKVISESTYFINQIHSANEEIKKDGSKTQTIIDDFRTIQNDWFSRCQNILITNELFLEQELFIIQKGTSLMRSGFNNKLFSIMHFFQTKKAELINFAKEIESKQNKEVVILKIDDFDTFDNISKIKATEVLDYAQDCFLEDDVEETFLEKLEEPYKELDGGAETRDLFTDRLMYDSKRLSTVFMFKGRGQKGELTIKKSGSTGNQLLKLAKNNSAECFIVQHINKISTDVREALQDHILQNTRLSKVYICFIDGVDTARFLKSVGKNLEELKNKTI